MINLELVLDGREMQVSVATAIVAGWTGRDRVAVEEHIAELEALGVPRPSAAPVFYRVSATRLTTAREIESTAASSGEVEAVLLRYDDTLYVGVGSDHTDREVESHGVAISKQMCDKPIGAEFWAYADVRPHWDRLTLRSWVDGDIVYQEGTLDALLHADDLVERSSPPITNGTLIFCGTFPAIGGIRPSETFRYSLVDPVLGRTIGAGYEMRVLPLIS